MLLCHIDIYTSLVIAVGRVTYIIHMFAASRVPVPLYIFVICYYYQPVVGGWMHACCD